MTSSGPQQPLLWLAHRRGLMSPDTTVGGAEGRGARARVCVCMGVCVYV
jgi:hypothetical protein